MDNRLAWISCNTGKHPRQTITETFSDDSWQSTRSKQNSHWHDPPSWTLPLVHWRHLGQLNDSVCRERGLWHRHRRSQIHTDILTAETDGVLRFIWTDYKCITGSEEGSGRSSNYTNRRLVCISVWYFPQWSHSFQVREIQRIWYTYNCLTAKSMQMKQGFKWCVYYTSIRCYIENDKQARKIVRHAFTVPYHPGIFNCIQYQPWLIHIHPTVHSKR